MIVILETDNGDVVLHIGKDIEQIFQFFPCLSVGVFLYGGKQLGVQILIQAVFNAEIVQRLAFYGTESLNHFPIWRVGQCIQQFLESADSRKSRQINVRMTVQVRGESKQIFFR